MATSQLKVDESRRRIRKLSYMVASSIESLPNELVTEVLARVAASSLPDFFNAKLSCKVFYEASDDSYIFQQMSLEKFPIVPWSKSKEASSSFLNRCKESGNPEALYREGVVDYFSHTRPRPEPGLESLRKAARSGHIGALYVLGLISLLSENDELKHQGLQIISDIKKKKSEGARGLRECRESFKAIIGWIWLRNPLLFQKHTPVRCTRQDQHRIKTGWGCNYEDRIQCDACQCDLEVASLLSMFPPL